MRDARGYDYTDRFEAPLSKPGSDRSAEAWIRAVFEGAPTAVRAFLLTGWRYGLGLRLGPATSHEHVLGWRIVERSEGSVTLAQSSWLLDALLRLDVEDDALSWRSSVRYSTRVAAVMWPPVSLLHRFIVPWLLRRAAGGER